MRLTDLIDGLGTATLDTGGCLSAAEARRLACDAAIVPMVLGSDSMPLDVGRQHRLATAALRDALAQRDKGCAFPSCDRSPRYCEATTFLNGSTGAKRNSTTRLLARCTYLWIRDLGWAARPRGLPRGTRRRRVNHGADRVEQRDGSGRPDHAG